MRTPQQALGDLRARLSETETRVLLLEGETLAEADPKAIKRLQELNAELIALEQDACSVDAAILEAERRVVEAQRAEQAVVERARGEEALKLKKQILDAAKMADAGLKQAFAGLSKIYQCVSALNRLGSGPHSQVCEANLKRVLVTSSLNSGFALGALAPVDRHTATELATRWGEVIDAFVEQHLGEQKIEPKVEEVAA